MSYIETSARYDKIQENGAVKKVTDTFIVDALSFTEAEARTIEEIKQYLIGEFSVSAVKKTKVVKILGDKESSRFYLAKVAFITINERTGAEKRSVSQWLLGAEDFAKAYAVLNEEINKSAADIEIQSLSETPIIGYFPNHVDPKG